MAWGSTAPAAITALVATLQAGMTTRVLDSAVVSDAGGKEVVNVGWQTEDQAPVEMTFDPYASAADLETVVINNAVRVITSKDAVAARARAFVLFNQVGTLIKANRTLGGAVMRAWVSSGSLDAQQGRGGALATILFAVTYEAETTE
jgi:hypothetical protein